MPAAIRLFYKRAVVARDFSMQANAEDTVDQDVVIRKSVRPKRRCIVRGHVTVWMRRHNSCFASIGSINVWTVHRHRATCLLEMAELVEKLPAGFLQTSDDVYTRLIALPQEHT